MKVRMTFDFGERVRRALNARFGEDGLADRERIEIFVEEVVDAAIAGAVADLEYEEEIR